MAIAIDRTSLGTAHPVDGSTISISTSATVAAGGFIVAVFGHFTDSPALSSVSGGGLSWSIDLQGPNPTASGEVIAIASAQAPSGLAASTTITGTWASTAIAQVMGAFSFTGVATSSPVDAAGTVNGATTGTAWTTNNVTLAAGSVLVGASYSESEATGSTITAPSIEAAEVVDAAAYALTSGYRIEASGGAVSVAGTWATTSTGIVSGGVAYKVGGPPVDTSGPASLRAGRYELEHPQIGPF